MRTFLTLTIILLVAVVPVMAQSAADEAAIRKVNEDRLAAWNAKDVNAYLVFYDDDCTQDWIGGPCAANIRESGQFPEAWKNAKLKVSKETGITFITPDVAIYRYTADGSGFVDEEGKPQPPGKTQYAWVYVKKGGKWLATTSFMQTVEE